MKGTKKKFQFRGRQILLFGLVALVITAGYYRWTIERSNYTESVPTASEALPEESQNNQETEEKTDGGIDALKRERDLARSKSIEQWQKVAQDSSSSQEAKRDAEKKIATENENADKERKVETMVKSKGYDDCFAYLSEGGIAVTVKGGEIDGSKVAQIKDIIITETNMPARNIKINAI